MSVKALVWALEKDDVFSSAHKFVLVALANYANDQGKSYPAVATLCRLTKQSDDTVRRCLMKLQEQGIIADTGKRYGPTQQVKVWELPEEAWKSQDPQGAGLQKVKDPRKTRERPAKDPQGAGQPLEPETLELKKGEEPLAEAAPNAPCPTRQFSDAWCAAYAARFGGKYPYNGRDAKAAAELVKLDNPFSLVEIAKLAWKQTDEKKCWACLNKTATTWDFLMSLGRIRVELCRVKAGQSNRPIEFHYERNQNH